MTFINQEVDSEIVFSSDGIRGIDGKWPFNAVGISQIGYALSEFVLQNKQRDHDPVVILGRDTRPLGQQHVQILSAHMKQAGIKVVDLGIAPTPVVAYLTKHKLAELGIVVSASHNPIKYNGIKFIDSSGLRLEIDKETKLKALINSPESRGDHTYPKCPKDYSAVDSESLIEEYISEHIHLLGSNSIQGLRLLVDCANGAVARTAKDLLTGLGAEVETLNADLTGHKKINESCGSEEVRKKPIKFVKLTRDKRADYGLAFDGDGDRVVVVDQQGNLYNGDDLLYVFATHFAKEGMLPGNVVVTTEMANSGLRKSLGKEGIHVIEVNNGDKNLEAVLWERKKFFRGFRNMRQIPIWAVAKFRTLIARRTAIEASSVHSKGYLLGGEQVGNIIIHDGKHGSADSLFAVSLLLGLLNAEGATLAEKTELFEKYPQVSAECHPNRKLPLVAIKLSAGKIQKSARVRVKYWYSSTEVGVFNLMVEGRKNSNLGDITSIALTLVHQICAQHKQQNNTPDIIDLSSRGRLEP